MGVCQCRVGATERKEGKKEGRKRRGEREQRRGNRGKKIKQIFQVYGFYIILETDIHILIALNRSYLLSG